MEEYYIELGKALQVECDDLTARGAIPGAVGSAAKKGKAAVAGGAAGAGVQGAGATANGTAGRRAGSARGESVCLSYLS